MSKKRSAKLNSDEISIFKFINEYLNIDGDCYRITHQELNELQGALIIKVSNYTVERCPELVANGSVLKVVDSKGKLRAYINPRLIEAYAFNQEKQKGTADGEQRWH